HSSASGIFHLGAPTQICVTRRCGIGLARSKATVAGRGSSLNFGAALATMENPLADLAEALRERLAVIRDQESRCDEAKHIARLRTVSEKIDRLQASLLPGIDPRLKHYLERKSYDKTPECMQGSGN